MFFNGQTTWHFIILCKMWTSQTWLVSVVLLLYNQQLRCSQKGRKPNPIIMFARDSRVMDWTGTVSKIVDHRSGAYVSACDVRVSISTFHDMATSIRQPNLVRAFSGTTDNISGACALFGIYTQGEENTSNPNVAGLGRLYHFKFRELRQYTVVHNTSWRLGTFLQ